ncbi:hypothetical protein BDV95DRAFT_604544 [Massariosphaeria phaeospora]|uniref:Uncharacterized protein n=1 Tax=Massariosphaeria phaeospora TaxID=100035 RepID=A0A7C8MCL2_9PLEO|nr:hypothetical protein BDV95DRAFT_604544 [Massariosphaeria phaeospora]
MASTSPTSHNIKTPFPAHRIQDFHKFAVSNVILYKLHDKVTHLEATLHNAEFDELLITDLRILQVLETDLPTHFDRDDIFRSNPRLLQILEQPAEVNAYRMFRLIPMNPIKADHASKPRVGLVVEARHPYLDFLELRQERYPKGPPTRKEVDTIAESLGRPPENVRRELTEHWDLENSTMAETGRSVRKMVLGEDPYYAQ